MVVPTNAETKPIPVHLACLSKLLLPNQKYTSSPNFIYFPNGIKGQSSHDNHRSQAIITSTQNMAIAASMQPVFFWASVKGIIISPGIKYVKKNLH